MFRYLENDSTGDRVTVFIDGSAVHVPPGISVAAAVLGHGTAYTRTTPVGKVPRAPFCMMGACYECLMVIDGRANRQACRETVRDGMRIEKQQGTGPAT